MAKKPARSTGIALLAVGVLMLTAGIVLLVTTDSIFISILLGGSILVNTAAVTLLLQGKTSKSKRRDKRK